MKKANKVKKYALKKNPEEVIKKFNKKNEQLVTYIEETLEKVNPRFGSLKWELKSQSELTKNEEVGGYTFSMVNRIFPVRPKTLKEARGYVVADYQEYLEKEWISNLEKEYKIEINNDVLNKLVKKL
jgi:peptidyl-prolyl cis-trans isomerase SurA